MSEEAKNLLRVEHLELRNFRCFSRCSVDFHEKLTVLVAENAKGKTALLDGLRIALNVFVAAIGKSPNTGGFSRKDVRIGLNKDLQWAPEPSVEFMAAGFVAFTQLSWSRMMSSDSRHARNSRKNIRRVQEAARQLAAQAVSLDIGNDPKSTVLLPMVAYYGTGRLWNDHRLTRTMRRLLAATHPRLSAYLDCLSPSSSFQIFSTWYHQTARSLRDPASTPRGLVQRPEHLLSAVRHAVRTVLQPSGWNELDWEFPVGPDGSSRGEGFLVVEHPKKGRFPISLLSDGVRSMVALVGDLAHRCARVNPHLGELAAKETPGVLLIDEVDLHLHPRWQQQVLGLLQAAFPCMQIIVSTHSPQVLTTVRKDNIRIVSSDQSGAWTAIAPEHSSLAQEPSDALAFIMGADPRPSLPLLNDLHRYEQLARAGLAESEDGKATLSRLAGAGFEFSDAEKALFAFLSRKVNPSKDDGHG